MSTTPHRRALGALAVCVALLLAGCSDDEAPPPVTPDGVGHPGHADPHGHHGHALRDGAPRRRRPRRRPRPRRAPPSPRSTATCAPPPSPRGPATPRGPRPATAVGCGSTSRGWRTARTRRSSPPRPTAAPPRCSPSTAATGSAATRRSGSSRPATRRPAADMVGKYVEISESDATENGSFTLRSILTEKFGLPEFAALESDRLGRRADQPARDRRLAAHREVGRAAVGRRRRQRRAAAGGRAEEQALGPQLHRLGPGPARPPAHRRPDRHRRVSAPGVSRAGRPGRAGTGATAAPGPTSR